MFCQNLIETLYVICAGCYLYFLVGNLTQNVYNHGNVSNTNNEFIVIISFNVSKLIDFAACHRLLIVFTGYMSKSND